MAHGEARLERSPVVLFLCTGNYYRSRFAELLFNAHAQARALPWRADSAGLAPECFAANAGAIARETREALRSRGIDVPNPARLPRDVSAADFERAQRVIAMSEAEHRPMLRTRFAAFEGKVEYWNAHDIDRAPAAEMLPQIEVAVLALLARLRTELDP